MVREKAGCPKDENLGDAMHCVSCGLNLAEPQRIASPAQRIASPAAE